MSSAPRVSPLPLSDALKWAMTLRCVAVSTTIRCVSIMAAKRWARGANVPFSRAKTAEKSRPAQGPVARARAAAESFVTSYLRCAPMGAVKGGARLRDSATSVGATSWR